MRFYLNVGKVLWSHMNKCRTVSHVSAYEYTSGVCCSYLSCCMLTCGFRVEASFIFLFTLEFKNVRKGCSVELRLPIFISVLFAVILLYLLHRNFIMAPCNSRSWTAPICRWTWRRGSLTICPASMRTWRSVTTWLLLMFPPLALGKETQLTFCMTSRG